MGRKWGLNGSEMGLKWLGDRRRFVPRWRPRSRNRCGRESRCNHKQSLKIGRKSHAISQNVAINHKKPLKTEPIITSNLSKSDTIDHKRHFVACELTSDSPGSPSCRHKQALQKKICQSQAVQRIADVITSASRLCKHKAICQNQRESRSISQR